MPSLHVAGVQLPPPGGATSQVPEVGGRLALFAHQWGLIGADDWVTSVVSQGYRLEFTDSPPATTQVRETPLPVAGPKRDALLGELQSLLLKKAVYPIQEEHLLPGFAAIFFLAPKKSGDWRPIINLRPLNAYIKAKHFRMETLSVVLRSPIKHSWTTSIDLRDAYLHIPIHHLDHKWLRFKILGQAYAFRCLPFGLSTAPRVFTRVVMNVAAFLRRQGVRIHMYLDDWLISAPSFHLAVQHTHFVLQTARTLGFIVNLDKSHLHPTQQPLFLGAQLDLVLGRVTPSPERVERLRTSVQSLFHSLSATAFVWLQVLGFMASMVDVVPWCRLRMRPLQLHLNCFYKPTIHSLSQLVPVSDVVREELLWWMQVQNLLIGAEFPMKTPQVTLTTDASSLGWGGGIWAPMWRAVYGPVNRGHSTSMYWN